MIRSTKVVLADDHPIFLAGLRALILAEDGMELVGEASSGAAALHVIREKLPDVAVLDITMPGLDGIALARRLSKECPTVRVLILTLHENRSYFNQALQAGVRGYVLKRTAAETLLSAIRAVFVGGLYLDPAMARVFETRHGRTSRSAKMDGQAELTEREREVLKLIALGQTNKEIARQFDVSVKTIETYKHRGAEKLGLTTRAEIVRYASAQGWLSSV